ncbi:high affinity immunoglobulin gamma Fc receptor I-like [Aplochiton taeniatus]
MGESSGWRSYWYRNSKGSVPVSVSEGVHYTFTPSSISEGGEFWCRGGRGHPVYYKDYSQPISINVTARPYAVLTLQPNWTQIYIGETVTLKCEIKGTEDFTNWKYNWNNKEGTRMKPISTTESEYKFNPTRIEMNEFTCKGVGDSVKGHSETSEPLRLTVSGKPRPVLRVSPSWLNPGDSVTLTCGLQVSSTDWRFYWYRTVPYQAGLPSLANQSYSVEPLMDGDHGTVERSYILHGATHTAGYVSDVILESPVHPVTEGDLVTLRCKHQNPSLVSKVDFYKDGELLQNGTSREITIPAVSKSHEGLYRCGYSDGEESPESWLLVRVVPSFLQRRLLFGLLVGSPYMLATILLVMIHRQRRAKSPAEDQPDYDYVGEDPETSPPPVAGPSSAP